MTGKELRVDLNSNTIYSYGISVLVPPRHAEIIYTLLKYWPGVVPRDRFIQMIWGHAEINDKTPNMTLSFTRKYLEPCGYGVKNHYMLGYSLVKL